MPLSNNVKNYKKTFKKLGLVLLTNLNVLETDNLAIQCSCTKIYCCTWQEHKLGFTCPFCKRVNKPSISLGERFILNFLTRKEITFIHQWKIPNSRYRFDFAIMDTNENIKCFLEFHGDQHYKPVELFGGSKAYEKQVLRDKEKSEWAIKNNIPIVVFNKEDQRNKLRFEYRLKLVC